VFLLTLPTLIFCAYPKVILAIFEQAVKSDEKCPNYRWMKVIFLVSISSPLINIIYKFISSLWLENKIVENYEIYHEKIKKKYSPAFTFVTITHLSTCTCNPQDVQLVKADIDRRK
jgi:hypothetical protein